MQNQVRLTHGCPHSESVQFITSAKPFWEIIRTGDQIRDRMKAVERIALSFLPSILPEAYEDLMSRFGR